MKILVNEYDLKFSVSTELCRSYNQIQSFTNGDITIEKIIRNVCKKNKVNKDFIPSMYDDIIGRIDLEKSNIISIDFSISNKNIGKRNSGFTLGGTSISDGVWGNLWEVDMHVVTIFGKRNFIQSFKVVLPMLSKYSTKISERAAKIRHKKLVLKYLEECTNSMSCYLEHFIKRIEE